MLPLDWELLFIMATAPEVDQWQQLMTNRPQDGAQIFCLKAEALGRGPQLNLGGYTAKGHWLWFLHADSLVRETHFQQLRDCIKAAKMPALYYFDLAFERDQSGLSRLNQWGANLRSRFLGMPFGDQGFFIQADLWQSLGCFNEDRSFGEDHAFVWACHHQKVPVISLRQSLGSSARKYRQHGWLNTTLRHIYLTVYQATPEIIKLLKIRTRQFL